MATTKKGDNKYTKRNPITGREKPMVLPVNKKRVNKHELEDWLLQEYDDD